MTSTPLTLPNLTTLGELAALLDVPPRRLRDRKKQFSHVAIGKEIYLTDAQLEEFLAAHTVAPAPTPTSDRDKAIQETRERVTRQRARRRTPAKA